MTIDFLFLFDLFSLFSPNYPPLNSVRSLILTSSQCFWRLCFFFSKQIITQRCWQFVRGFKSVKLLLLKFWRFWLLLFLFFRLLLLQLMVKRTILTTCAAVAVISLFEKILVLLIVFGAQDAAVTCIAVILVGSRGHRRLSLFFHLKVLMTFQFIRIPSWRILRNIVNFLLIRILLFKFT